MNTSLSGDEILQLLDGNIKILRYRDLDRNQSLDDLLAPFGRVAILIESKPNVGHWTLLHKLKGKNVEFFDSYGLCVDDELDYVNPEFRKASNQFKKHLTKLMIQPKYKIHYNDYPLQALKEGASTCGRWCVCRAINNDMSIDKFHKQIKAMAKNHNLTKDELVCELVKI